MTSENKILIVDDAPSVLAMMKDILKPYYVVKTASRGKMAIDIVSEFIPDLILLDVMMPEMDGYDVCRQIRENKKFNFIKIIMVSIKATLEERLKGYEAGADDYIVKPFKKEELLAKVRVFMRLKSVEDQLRDLNAILNEQVRLRTEQLIEAEKMAAIGRYSAGVVHNLSTPLQVIMGNAELLSMKCPENRNIMNLRKAAAQMKKIIGTIMSTAHRESKSEYTDVNLNEVIKDQVELFKANHFFKHKIHTKMNLTPLPNYRGIYLHFSQSFGNLIKNAAEAMYESEHRELFIFSSVENNMIQIEISDTGCGISKSKMGKIFDPFYTTKPLTAADERPTGTGLGLASTKEMIESYGGKIMVTSQEKKGTTFTVQLPII